MKIFELAREMDVKAGAIVQFLIQRDVPVKNHMSNIDSDMETLVRVAIEKGEVGGPDPTGTPPPSGKKPATRPWNQADNPWSLNLLRINRRKGWRPRFFTQENIKKGLDQGWKLAEKKDYGELPEEQIGESGKMDTRVTRRELILMEMPEELAVKRDEYIQWKTNQRTQDMRRMASNEVGKIERGTGERLLIQDDHRSSRAGQPVR